MTERDTPEALSKIAVGSAGDWRTAGLTERQFRTLVGCGQLVKIRHGSYATRSILAEAQADPGMRHALQVIAVRATRSYRGVASHHSAAIIHGLDLLHRPQDGTVTLTMPPGSRTGGYRPSAGVICHAAELPDKQVARLYGVPVTTAARTVADIARTCPFMEGVVVADSALRERGASKADLRRVLARCERWPGIGQARRVVDFASPLAESVLESCARVFFDMQGLAPPELQVHVFGGDGTLIARADFCWRRYRVIAEADGLLKYQDREDMLAHFRRDRLLQEAGYEVIHFTWQELFSDPARVAGRIRAAFARASRLGAAARSIRTTSGASSVVVPH